VSGVQKSNKFWIRSIFEFWTLRGFLNKLCYHNPSQDLPMLQCQTLTWVWWSGVDFIKKQVNHWRMELMSVQLVWLGMRHVKPGADTQRVCSASDKVRKVRRGSPALSLKA
jgi:hypothetical protein